MTVLSLILPEINKPDSTEDPKINTALTTIQNWANGNIDTTNVKDESLTGKDLGAETVRLLSTTAWTAQAAQTLNAKHLVSASRPAEVSLTLTSPNQAPTIEAQLLVNGVQITKWALVGEQATRVYQYPFKIGAGLEWEVKSGSAWVVEAAFLIL